MERNEYFNLTKEMVGGYVKANNAVKRFHNTTHRVVEIDLDEAEKIGLDVSGYGDMSDIEDEVQE